MIDKLDDFSLLDFVALKILMHQMLPLENLDYDGNFVEDNTRNHYAIKVRNAFVMAEEFLKYRLRAFK